MAAKKRSNNNSADQNSTAQLKSNPFSAMKGFCVSKPAQQERTRKVPSSTQAKQDKATDAEQTTSAYPEADFANAMSGIGVEPLSRDDEDMAPESDMGYEEQAHEAQPATPAEVSSFDVDELDDSALFLHHLGKMDAVFRDAYPEDEFAHDSGSARRMKLLRKGKLRPEARLDLHGCYREEACQRVRHFLENRQHQGLKTVLIITGRGQRSSAGDPVLRNEIETYLDTKARAWVAEWGRAPKQYGGDGALVVFLRQSRTTPQS